MSLIENRPDCESVRAYDLASADPWLFSYCLPFIDNEAFFNRLTQVNKAHNEKMRDTCIYEPNSSLMAFILTKRFKLAEFQVDGLHFNHSVDTIELCQQTVNKLWQLTCKFKKDVLKNHPTYDLPLLLHQYGLDFQAIDQLPAILTPTNAFNDAGFYGFYDLQHSEYKVRRKIVIKKSAKLLKTSQTYIPATVSDDETRLDVNEAQVFMPKADPSSSSRKPKPAVMPQSDVQPVFKYDVKLPDEMTAVLPVSLCMRGETEEIGVWTGLVPHLTVFQQVYASVDFTQVTNLSFDDVVEQAHARFSRSLPITHAHDLTCGNCQRSPVVGALFKCVDASEILCDQCHSQRPVSAKQYRVLLGDWLHSLPASQPLTLDESPIISFENSTIVPTLIDLSTRDYFVHLFGFAPSSRSHVKVPEKKVSNVKQWLNISSENESIATGDLMQRDAVDALRREYWNNVMILGYMETMNDIRSSRSPDCSSSSAVSTSSSSSSKRQRQIPRLEQVLIKYADNFEWERVCPERAFNSMDEINWLFRERLKTLNDRQSEYCLSASDIKSATVSLPLIQQPLEYYCSAAADCDQAIKQASDALKHISMNINFNFDAEFEKREQEKRLPILKIRKDALIRLRDHLQRLA